MANKPISFNTDMVRAILDGQKTVTRRGVKPQPFDVRQQEDAKCWCGHFVAENGKVLTDKPPYTTGDILYARESFWKRPSGKYSYRADYTGASGWKWRPSIHMPREAARIFLRVTGVRVERLRDMTEQDAIKEGCEQGYIDADVNRTIPAISAFEEIWDRTIKPVDRAVYGWAANPWVWVIEFERISKEEAIRDE